MSDWETTARELLAERDALRRQLAEALSDGNSMGVQMVDGARTIAALRARVETLKGVIKPFACTCGEWCHGIDGEMSKNPDCARRRARIALAGKE